MLSRLPTGVTHIPTIVVAGEHMLTAELRELRKLAVDRKAASLALFRKDGQTGQPSDPNFRVRMFFQSR